VEPISLFFVKKGGDLCVDAGMIAVEGVAGLRGQVVGIDEITIEGDIGQRTETKEASICVLCRFNSEV
jgi:hypothetical protein